MASSLKITLDTLLYGDRTQCQILPGNEQTPAQLTVAEVKELLVAFHVGREEIHVHHTYLYREKGRMKMDERTFWQMIDASHERSHQDRESQLRQLQTALVALPGEEIISFNDIKNKILIQAWKHPALIEAYSSGGFLSDDGYEYTIAGLILAGQDLYMEAWNDPQQFAATYGFSEWEEALYVALEAYEQKTGHEIPVREQKE